jgi:hypothetical protein
VVVATLRAEIEHTRALINAYEDLAGDRGSGTKTTEWNVLDGDTLKKLRSEAKAALVTVEKASLSRGPAAPLNLELRKREIEQVLRTIDSEIGGRQSDVVAPTLISIDPALTTDQVLNARHHRGARGARSAEPAAAPGCDAPSGQ